MALPTFRAASAVAEGGAADLAYSLPTGWEVDDIFLLCIASADEAVTAPSGWTAVADSPQSATGQTRITVLWRRAQSGDTGPTVTSPGNHQVGFIAAFSGCITTGDPWDVTSGGSETTGDTTGVVPGDTTTVADCLVAIVVSDNVDSTNPRYSAWANSDLANVTERFDDGTTLGNGSGVGMATGEKASAGAYGDTTYTCTINMQKAYMTIALKPPAVGSSVSFEVGQIAF